MATRPFAFRATDSQSAWASLLNNFVLAFPNEQDGTYSIQATDRYTRAGGGAVLTLPKASSVTGLPFTVKCADSGSITLKAYSGEKIDDAPEITIEDYGCADLVSYGDGWDLRSAYMKQVDTASIEVLLARLLREQTKTNLILQEASLVTINDEDVPDIESTLIGNDS